MAKFKLPTMQCDSDCGECCGIVPVTKKEYDTILDFVWNNNIKLISQGSTCPFYNGQCSIYSVRPLICRIFGHSPRLPCKKGYNVDVPDRKLRKMIDKNGEAFRVLHDMIAVVNGTKPVDVESLIKT